ncbi:MAG: hypothetical protein ACMUJM_03390 [bacterium]
MDKIIPLVLCVLIQILFISTPADIWAQDNYIKIDADEFDINLTSGEGIAKGNIQITDPNYYILRAKVLHYNFKTHLYSLNDADLFLFPARHIQSSFIEKKNPEVFHLKNVYFTSCDSASPLWSVSARTGEVSPTSYLKISHLIIRCKKLPLFYLPKISIPLKKAGYTGLKLPEVGSSSKNGLTVKVQYNSLLIPFNKSEFYLDYYEKQGLGTGALLEYDRDRIHGDAKIYGIFKKGVDARHEFDCTLAQSTDSGQRAVVELHQSDKNFYYDFEQKTSILQESRAFIHTTQPPFSFLLLWDQIETLRHLKDEKRARQPHISMHFTPFPLKYAPSMVTAMTGLHGSFADFHDNNAQQGIISPYIILKMPVRNLIDVKGKFGIDTLYDTSTDPNQADESEKKYFTNYTQSITLSGPRLYRNYSHFSHLTYIRILYHSYTIHLNDDAQGDYSYFNYYASLQKERYLAISFLNRLFTLKNTIIELDIKEHFNLIDERRHTELSCTSRPSDTLHAEFRLYYNNDKDHRLDFNLLWHDTTHQQMALSWLYKLSSQNDRAISDETTITDTPALNTIKISYTTPSIKNYQIHIAKYCDIEKKEYNLEDTYELRYAIECFSGTLAFTKTQKDTSIKATFNIRF